MAKNKKAVDAIIAKAGKRLAAKDKAMLAAALKKGKARLEALPVPKPRIVKTMPLRIEPPLTAILKAGIKKIVEKGRAEDKDAAAAWVDADQQLKKDPAKVKKPKAAHPPSAVPVESDKPGIARNPKPPKVVKPATADGSLVPLEIISYHFLKLMERMAAEHGGSSAQALVDFKADIARRAS